MIFGIFQQLRDAFQAAEQILDIGEVAIGRQFHRRNPIRHRPHGFEYSALEREDVLHVPFERGRHADEAHGFGGRRAIQHDHLVMPLAPVLIHVHHGAQLFHARQDGQLFGLHVADAGGAQHRDDVSGNLAPMPLDLLLDIDFLDGEAVVDGQRIVGSVLEQAGFQIEGVGQAVGRIDAHHQSAVAEPRKLQTGGRGNAGLAHASFAAEEQDAHALILARYGLLRP